MILDLIKNPNDIKKVPHRDLPELAQEIRELIIDRVSENGGHLASNLGVVELTMALHRTFDLPKDKIIWDVGHQSYTHKILTGRKDDFAGLRTFGGISGFPNTEESCCDPFTTGHSSASVSAGLGLVHARDLSGLDYNVISVMGDGSLTGGMIYEALNNASRLKSNFIIILNDNNMSISENIGGVSKMMNNIRSDRRYNSLKESISDAIGRIPVLGEPIVRSIKSTKKSIKQLIIPGMFFENMGLTYLGPFDGNDIDQMMDALRYAKRLNRAVVIHAMTKKGRGYKPAQHRPELFHGVGPFDRKTGRMKNKPVNPSYDRIFSKKICELAENDEKIVAITAAMADGVGLRRFSRRWPERFFDVGIAEEHAVTFAGGLAAGGMKPFVCIYSSFLQRAYDQIVQDACLQKLPVKLIIDRAGIVGADGETHQGTLDISYLSSIPGMTVFAPKNAAEYEAAIEFALSFEGPIAIRTPRGEAFTGLSEHAAPIEYAKSEIITGGGEVALLAIGSMNETAAEVRERLAAHGIGAGHINARFALPIDKDMLISIASSYKLIVTMEENVRSGGYGEHVQAFLDEAGCGVKTLNISIPDCFVKHGSREELCRSMGIDADNVAAKILEYMNETGTR